MEISKILNLPEKKINMSPKLNDCCLLNKSSHKSHVVGHYPDVDMIRIDSFNSPSEMKDMARCRHTSTIDQQSAKKKRKRAPISKRQDLEPEEMAQLRLKVNCRERKRMHDLNGALDALRDVIPYAKQHSVKKLSKMATLLLARNYIEALHQTIEELKELLKRRSEVSPQSSYSKNEDPSSFVIKETVNHVKDSEGRKLPHTFQTDGTPRRVYGGGSSCSKSLTTYKTIMDTKSNAPFYETTTDLDITKVESSLRNSAFRCNTASSTLNLASFNMKYRLLPFRNNFF